MKVDVAIAGGGPAGLAAAIHAARAGLSVALFEREELPRDKACGEGIMPPGLQALERLGARRHLEASDWAPILGIRYLQEDGSALEGRLPGAGGIGVRRTALARVLLDQAKEAGVSVHARTAVRAHGRSKTGMAPGRQRSWWLLTAWPRPCAQRRDWTFLPPGHVAMGCASTSA